jgi:hypothetical protein
MQGTHVLVVGNPADGFRFYGPITPNDPALELFIETELRNEDWWYAELRPLPAMLAPAEDTNPQSKVPTTATCAECGRVFDLTDEDDANEWYHGHDCEVA